MQILENQKPKRFAGIILHLHPKSINADALAFNRTFGLGGMAGMYLGARCQKFVPARAIKWMLSGVMAFTAIKYISEFFGY